MKGFRNEIKHIMRAVTVLAALFAMTFVAAGSAYADEAGILGNSIGLQSAILNPFVASQAFVRPPLFNPFFRPAINPFFRPNPFIRPAINPFFRPPVFNPFFRPAINPFFGADLDDLDDVGLGLGLGIRGLGVGLGDLD